MKRAARRASPASLFGPHGRRASAQRLSLPTREILDKLPGGAPGAGAADRGPLQRIRPELICVDKEPEMVGVAADHGEVFVLAAAVEAEPEAEAIRQRNLLLHSLAGIDRRGALVLHHVARQQMAT